MKILKYTNWLQIDIPVCAISGATCLEQLAHEHCHNDGNVAILGEAEHLI